MEHLVPPGLKDLQDPLVLLDPLAPPEQMAPLEQMVLMDYKGLPVLLD